MQFNTIIIIIKSTYIELNNALWMSRENLNLITE